MKRLSQHTLIILCIVALSAVVTAIVTTPTGIGIKAEAGQVARTTYKSPRTVTYKSDLKTAEAEKAAAEAVPNIYHLDQTASSQQDAKFTATVAALNAIRAGPSRPAEKAKQIQEVANRLTADQALRLASADEPAWQQVQATARNALAALQTTQLRPEEVAKDGQLVEARLPQGLDPSIRDAAKGLAGQALVANYVVDQEKTEAARKKAAESVAPVSYTVERDQVIVYRGQVITEFDVERLRAVGLTRPDFNLEKTAGVGLLVLLFSTLLLYIAPSYAKNTRYPSRTFGLLISFTIMITLAGVLVVPAQPIFAYILPIAAPVLLLTIFYGFNFAIISGVCFTALYALASGGSFELFFIHLAATTGVVLFAGRITSIAGFVRSGLLVTAIVFVGITAFSLLSANFQLENVPKFFLAAALNGALTSTFVFAGVAFLGNLLGSVTFLQLLELENPRHPLLRKLAREAPGTYSHSLRMAAIVEKVAEDIQADPLLARVQTLYHDIGKIALPEYFVENQRGGKNLHQEMDPKESADILRAHISEGIALAKQYGLPAEVAAAIPEHHGTTLMAYFWNAAKKKNKRAKPEDFRYYGPRPRSKETAIIMLADAVEAASRTLENPDEKMIRNLIHDLFTARIDDGQLDQAPLSTRELTVMKQAFSEAVVTDLHKRIKYPRG